MVVVVVVVVVVAAAVAVAMVTINLQMCGIISKTKCANECDVYVQELEAR